MSGKKNRQARRAEHAKQKSSNSISLGFVKEALTLIGGLAGSILAVYGLVKTFKDDVEGFSWLILVGIAIWLLFLWRLLQVRKTTAYSLFIISVLAGVIGWVGWQSQVKAVEKKVVVLVTQFDGPEETYGLRRQMMEDLQEATKDYNDTVVIESDELVDSSENARNLGEKKKADLVIWAWYRPTENPNITIHIENLSPTQLDTLQASETYQPTATLSQLESFEIQRQIGSETSTLVTFLSGLLKFKSDDYQTAIERFNQILEENDISTFISRYDLFDNLGYSYFSLGKYDQAIQSFDRAIEINPQIENSYLNRGMAFGFLSKYDQAIQDFNKAIEINPKSFKAYDNRGNSYTNTGWWDRALEDYEKAIEVNPQFFSPYSNRGIVYAYKKQYELAIQDYNKAIDLNPQVAVIFMNRGNAYAGLKKYDRAIQDYDKAIELDPNLAYAYNNRRLAYQALGKIAAAEADLKKYEELTGEKP